MVRAATDTSAVSIIQGSPSAPFLFVCEHASRHIPREFNNLGLDDAAAASHIAWDPGALEVTENLARLFNATAVCGTISRLIYDLNRAPDAIDAMPAKSEVFDIPGNKDLSAEEKHRRVNSYYRPFQQTLENEIKSSRRPPVLVTIHSFTPTYNGKPRQVEFGILNDRDTRFSDVMLSIATRHTTLDTQRNEPYGPEHGVTHTLIEHGLKNGLLNVMIEIRNDHLQTAQQCKELAKSLAGWLEEALAICASAGTLREAGT